MAIDVPVHWGNITSTRKKFPQLQITDGIYEIDRNRYIYEGGTTVIDMMHHLISKQYGRRLGSSINEILLINYERFITDTALICGFSSTANFSKCYRNFFGLPPNGERQLFKPDAPIDIRPFVGSKTA